MLGMIAFWPQMDFYFCINYNWRIFFIETKFVENMKMN
jgi:hypothetical protein